jgi:hypothetical protein
MDGSALKEFMEGVAKVLQEQELNEAVEEDNVQIETQQM